MRIAVPVKQVASLDDDEFELMPDGRGVDPDYLERELNEWDAFSLEAALELKEAHDGVDVLVLTVGDEESEDVLLASLAKGADRAIRVSDEGIETADPLVVARVLAGALEREAPDLVLCGVQASDTVNGATGVALAELLGFARVAVVRRLELDMAARAANVERELEGGLAEVLKIQLPALLTVQTGINEPRYATLRAIKQAKEKPRSSLTLDELGLDVEDIRARAGGRIRTLSRPEEGPRAEMLDGKPADVAARILEIMRDRVAT
jgi:electron transfer flavoprotein beta subunit